VESLEFRVNPPCPPLKGGSGEWFAFNIGRNGRIEKGLMIN
jgi:hypothetical protein